MTDYIKEMMKTAGVEQEEEKYCYFECKKPELRNIACNNTQCTHYRHVIHPYPNFTAEKQLTLENLIIKEVGYIRIDYTNEIQDKISRAYQYNIFGGSYEVHSKNYVASTRAEALAQLTINLMKANELDKEKVKEILEG